MTLVDPLVSIVFYRCPTTMKTQIVTTVRSLPNQTAHWTDIRDRVMRGYSQNDICKYCRQLGLRVDSGWISV